jgi:two-component system, NarL family, nitrate/nitrite response regulator NarL
MQTRASTIIVAERPLLREGVASLLASSGYKVIAAASRASEVHDVLAATRGRTLVIFGVAGRHCGYDSLAESIGLFRSLSSDVKIVVLAETAGPVDLQRIVSLAPDGYILNLSSREILLKTLELTLLDQKIFVLGEQADPSATSNTNGSHQQSMTGNSTSNVRAASHDGSEPHFPPLSPREMEVLVCLSRGDSNKQIARSCKMAESTVKVHLKTILRKLYAQNRTQAAIVAIAHGLVGGEAHDAALQPHPDLPGNPATTPDFGSFVPKRDDHNAENQMVVA